MKQSPFERAGRGAALACALALFVFLPPRAALAVVTGSKHDFTGITGSTLAGRGVCAACHIAHTGQADKVIWARSLAEEAEEFLLTTNPGYVPRFTILCYDCHDNHATASADGADNDPADTPSFDSSRLPQDVAFDDDMRTTVPRDGRNSTETPPKPGYFENVPSGSSGGASTYVSGHFFKTDPGGTSTLEAGDKLPCADCHDPHSSVNQAFIRRDLGGKDLTAKRASTNMAYTYAESPSGRNDAESREFCIACHGTDNQVTNPAVAFSSISPQYGSGTIAAPPTGISAHRAGSDTACTDCHKHNMIKVSCTDCHGFPPLRTIAEAGAAFDKVARPDVENYVGGAGAHLRHRDALGAAIFSCEICHGPDPGSASWHNQGNGAFPPTNPGQNVNMMGLDIYWTAPGVGGYPAGSLTPSYNGDSDRTPDPGDAAYVFSSMGGGNQRCAGFACHGDPPNEADALTWTSDMIDGDAPEAVKSGDLRICKWCHDATSPSAIDFDPAATIYTYARGVMGNNLSTAAGFGAEVNGHGVGLDGAVKQTYDRDAVGTPGTAGPPQNADGAKKECTVCHNATYFYVQVTPPVTAPRRTHFGTGTDPRDTKRLPDSINGAPIGTAETFPTGPDQACSACHQNGVSTVADGLDVSHHGNPAVAGYQPLEGDFTRACRQCHEVHGANFNGAGRNLYMVGTWIDANGDRRPSAGDGAYVDSIATTNLAAITVADNAVVFTATTGADSFDENDGPYDPANDTDDVCATCHTPAAGNPAGGGTGGGTHSGLASTSGMRDQDYRGDNCLTCHDHDFDDDHTTANAFMPSGCNACHGRATADGTDTQTDPAYNGQYWPDGTAGNPAYADDDPGAHFRHVQFLAQQLYARTPAQIATDSTAQRAICAFCHPNPGGGGHTTNDGARDPASRVTVYLDVDDTGARTDVFGKLTVGAQASGQDLSGANSDQAYNYGTRSCANLVCHNQAPTPTSASTPAGDWDTPPSWAALPPNTTCSNISCHAATTYTIAHAPHVNGSVNGSSGKPYACTECHANNAANLQHGNGEVDIVFTNAGSLEAAHGGNGFYDKNPNGTPDPAPGDTAFAYKSGGGAAADPTYARSCYRVYCHGGDNNATYPPDWGGTGNTPNTRSPVWNWDAAGALSLACTTCHATAPTTARHIAHDNNNAWVGLECGACHEANNDKTTMTLHQATHVDGSVNLGGNATIYTYNGVDGTCTNSCHDVSAATGDWLDAAPLACTDCHSGTYIGTPPASGLHAAATALAHDVQFPAGQAELPEDPSDTGTCTSCHLASGPSATHLNGSAGATPPTEDSIETAYAFAANIHSYAQAAGCQATCHSDYRVSSTTGLPDPAGLWRRKWVGVADAKPLDTDNPGAAVCDNCHGDGIAADLTRNDLWNLDEANASTTDHVDPYAGNTGDRMSAHAVCQTCHGWGHTAYDRAWAGTAPGHGDGSITMNGPDDPPGPAAGAEYDDATGGCAKACHVVTIVLNTNSGWPANYGDFGTGACEHCHGPNPPPGYEEAPNVMGDGNEPDGTGSPPLPYDNGTYGFNVNGHGANGSATNTPRVEIDPGPPPVYQALSPAANCLDCHGPLLGHHLDGVLQGAHGPGRDNRPNTYHLKTDGANPFVPASASQEYTVQLTFDRACWLRCHQPQGVGDLPYGMRHSKDSLPASLAVRFGDKGTVADGETLHYPSGSNGSSRIYPVDSDLSDLAATGGSDFAPCVSCHDVHGTAVAEPAKNTNRMVRDNFYEQSTLCKSCH